MLLQITGSNQPIRYLDRSTATLVRNRVGSTERATDEIGFSATIGLREGLIKVIEWRDRHRAGTPA